MRDVQPDNPTPVLACEGGLRCGFVKHRFLRSVRNDINATIGQYFGCGICDAERLWGLLDPRLVGTRVPNGTVTH